MQALRFAAGLASLGKSEYKLYWQLVSRSVGKSLTTSNLGLQALLAAGLGKSRQEPDDEQSSNTGSIAS